MSSADRDNNFTDKQFRGLEMVIKSTSKKYPFIKGGGLAKGYERWSSTLYIELFIDVFETADFLNLKVKDYYKDNPNLISSLSLSPFFTDEKENEDYSEMYERIFNLGYDLRRDINNYLNNLYSKLPKEYQIYYVFNSLFGEKEELVTLNTDNFKQYNI